MSSQIDKNQFQKSLPNAANVLVVLIVIDKSMFPPKITVQVFDAPPAGLAPVKNRPSCISGRFGKSHRPST